MTCNIVNGSALRTLKWLENCFDLPMILLQSAGVADFLRLGLLSCYLLSVFALGYFHTIRGAGL